MENNVLQKRWVQGSNVVVDDLRGTMFTGEIGAHTFLVSGVGSAQETVPITGTITGRFLAANNVSIPLEGSVADGVASLTLTEDCYIIPGRFVLSIYATNGGVKQCIYCGVGNVFRTQSDIIEYPSASIPDIEQIIADAQAAVTQINADVAAAQAAVAAAQTAVDGIEAQRQTMIESIASVAGQGTDTTLSQSGVAADAKAAGDQISDLKSAFDTVCAKKVINTNEWEFGSYDPSNGGNFPTNTRIRTKKYINLDQNIYGLISYNNYSFCVFAWNKTTGDYVGALRTNGNISTSGTVAWVTSFDLYNHPDYNYKIGMRKTTSPTSNMQLTDAENTYYVVSNVDDTLLQSGVAADSKKVGELIYPLSDAYELTINEIYRGFVDSSRPAVQSMVYDYKRNVFYLAYYGGWMVTSTNLTAIDTVDGNRVIKSGLAFGHANDMAYAGGTVDRIYCACGDETENGTVAVIDPDDMTVVGYVSPSGFSKVYRISYSIDEKLLYVSDNDTIKLYTDLSSAPIATISVNEQDIIDYLRLNSDETLVSQGSFIYNGEYCTVNAVCKTNTLTYIGCYVVAISKTGTMKAYGMPTNLASEEYEAMDTKLNWIYGVSNLNTILTRTFRISPKTKTLYRKKTIYEVGEEMPENTNMNELFTPGKYTCKSGTIAATFSNMPAGFQTAGFTLDVVPLGYGCVRQIIVSTINVTEHYERMYNPDIPRWYGWYKLSGYNAVT